MNQISPKPSQSPSICTSMQLQTGRTVSRLNNGQQDSPPPYHILYLCTNLHPRTRRRPRRQTTQSTPGWSRTRAHRPRSTSTPPAAGSAPSGPAQPGGRSRSPGVSRQHSGPSQSPALTTSMPVMKRPKSTYAELYSGEMSSARAQRLQIEFGSGARTNVSAG